MLIRMATLRITCSQFQQPSPAAATRGEAEVRLLNFKTTWSEFHYLPRVGPKQLTHLECTRAADTSLTKYLISKLSLVGKVRASFLDYFNPSKITLISIHILQIIQALYVT